jgi:MEMO1 family protein
MKTRKMICSGRFYPEKGGECICELKKLFSAAENKSFTGRVLGGIIPHAGWIFSGIAAARVFNAIAEKRSDTDTFVLFGACHCGMASAPILSSRQLWQSPLGDMRLDIELTADITEKVADIRFDDFVHDSEHSIEVNIPFIKYAFPNAEIVPIIIPPCTPATQLEQIGEVLAAVEGKKIAVLGSTDLTHYGQDYGFTPRGIGERGCKWAKEVNDASILQKIEAMDAAGVIKEAQMNYNACGAGAIAAAITTSKYLGADKATVLEHITSNEIMQKKFGCTNNSSVGYAAVVFTKDKRLC